MSYSDRRYGSVDVLGSWEGGSVILGLASLSWYTAPTLSTMAVSLLMRAFMARVVAVYHDFPLRLPNGRTYTALACGRKREDSMWEGWFEFVRHDGGEVLRSERETAQPSLADLEYWTRGITAVYLDGVLERTLTPVYHEPAPPKQPVTLPAREPVLNPFLVYAKGEQLLRQHLAALPPWQLRATILDYDLAAADVNLEALTTTDLIDVIVAAVRTRFAA